MIFDSLICFEWYRNFIGGNWRKNENGEWCRDDFNVNRKRK